MSKRRCCNAGMFREQVWNSASSELFMFGKSSLLAELRFAPDYRRGNLQIFCLKRYIRLVFMCSYSARLHWWGVNKANLIWLMFTSHQVTNLWLFSPMCTCCVKNVKSMLCFRLELAVFNPFVFTLYIYVLVIVTFSEERHYHLLKYVLTSTCNSLLKDAHLF